MENSNLEALKAANAEVSEACFVALDEQGAKTAANMLMMYDKDALSPGGFITSIARAHESSLVWLLANGYVTLTEKSQATDEEKAERAKRAAAAKDRMSGQTQPGRLPVAADGMYL